MALTELDIKELEDIMEKIADCEEDTYENVTDGYYDLWKKIWNVMERDNNYTDKQGDEDIDFLLNWLGEELSMNLHNEKRYQEVIDLNQQILKIQWTEEDDNLIHENAKREIADAYADLGDYKKCIQLYEKYLSEDPLWGWAWIGYFRQLKEKEHEKYLQVLYDLYDHIMTDGIEYRDGEDLLFEMKEEFKSLNKFKMKNGCVKKLKEITKGKKNYTLDPSILN